MIRIINGQRLKIADQRSETSNAYHSLFVTDC